MKSYIHYVHDLSEKNNSWFFSQNKRRKRISEFRRKFTSINELQQAILKESSTDVYDFVSEHLDLKKYFRHIIFSTNTRSYVDNVDFSNVRAIINFKLLNNIRELNGHLISVNKLLPDAGIYIGRIESYGARKMRLCKNFGKRFGKFIWLMDFVWNRIIPRIRPLKKFYQFITNNKHRVISQAEILGRLTCLTP